MPFSVPLQLETLDAVIYRLDPIATRNAEAPGSVNQGYDDVFREPVVFDLEAGASVAGRITTRKELPAIRVPCQMETQLYENQQMSSAGDLPQTRIGLVVYRPDMKLLKLVDAATGNLLIAKGDRVARVERRGLHQPVLVFPDDGFYVDEVVPASFGFGLDGYDLNLIYLTRRDPGTAA